MESENYALKNIYKVNESRIYSIENDLRSMYTARDRIAEMVFIGTRVATNTSKWEIEVSSAANGSGILDHWGVLQSNGRIMGIYTLPYGFRDDISKFPYEVYAIMKGKKNVGWWHDARAYYIPYKGRFPELMDGLEYKRLNQW